MCISVYEELIGEKWRLSMTAFTGLHVRSVYLYECLAVYHVDLSEKIYIYMSRELYNKSWQKPR